jgi:gliding motility-associated-like protein
MTTFFKLIFIVSLIHASILCAQIRVEQNAVLTISNNTLVSCATSVFNSGRISNSGTINLGYDWINNGEYLASDDTIRFTGVNNQQVDCNGYGFSNVILDGEGIHVISDLTISNSLILNRGYIRPIPLAEFRLGENAVIENASVTSHIKGRLIWNGTGDKFYPVGTEGNYLPAWLHIQTSDNVSDGLEVFEPNLITGVQNGIARVFSEAYWQMSVLSGDITDTRISLSYEHFPVSEPEMLAVAELSNTGMSYRSLGCGAIDEYASVITSREEISGSIFTIAEIDGLITICNVISPNGDAINDYLFIANIEEFPENEVMIFNRAGQLLYTEESYRNTWDGSIDGKFLPAGNYYCIVKLSDILHTYSQTITIVR